MHISKFSRTPLVKFDPEKMKSLMEFISRKKIASFLDVTDLKADTQSNKIIEMVDWAKTYGCASICVNPVEATDILPSLLKNSAISECYVVDFPLGKMDIEMKANLTSHTVNKSREIRGEGKGNIDLDMVINVGRFKSDPVYTLEEINAVCDAADGEHVKVIVRSAELTEEELYKVSEIVAESNAHFIKNSTGMDAYGAMPEHIRIMREVVGSTKGVKAAGGISDGITAMKLIYAGAPVKALQTPDLFRLGTSKPLSIINSLGELSAQDFDSTDKDQIPCSVCPFYYVDNLRENIRSMSIQRCKGCKYSEYRNL